MDVIGIYNMALGKVGTRTTVSSTTEGSNEANSCNVFYASTRDALLRTVQWNFCRKQALLTQLKSSLGVPNTCPAPWAYEYAYPSDCLRMRFLLPQISSTQVNGIPITSVANSAAPNYSLGPPVPFAIALDTDSSGLDVRVILTNQFQAQGVYTKAITDPNLFDAEFIELFCTILGMKVARNLTADKEIIESLRAEAVQLLNDAAADNGNEGLEINNPTPDWMRARSTLLDDLSVGFQDFDSLFQVT